MLNIIFHPPKGKFTYALIMRGHTANKIIILSLCNKKLVVNDNNPFACLIDVKFEFSSVGISSKCIVNGK